MVSSWIFALFIAFAGVSGTVGATTLTEAQLAAHDHAAGVQSAHKSTERDNRGVPHCALGTSGHTGSSASHTHSLTGVKRGSASRLPPNYALAYNNRVA